MQSEKFSFFTKAFTLTCLAFIALSLGAPKISAKHAHKNLVFPQGFAINQTDQDSIAIPSKFETGFKFEIYNQENTKLTHKNFVELSNDKSHLIALDRSKPFTIVFYDQNQKAYPIATEVLAKEKQKA